MVCHETMKAVQLQFIAARFLSVYIGFNFNHNLSQLFQNDSEQFCAILLIAVSFKFIVNKWIENIEIEQMDASRNDQNEQSGRASGLSVTDLFPGSSKNSYSFPSKLPSPIPEICNEFIICSWSNSASIDRSKNLYESSSNIEDRVEVMKTWELNIMTSFQFCCKINCPQNLFWILMKQYMI